MTTLNTLHTNSFLTHGSEKAKHNHICDIGKRYDRDVIIEFGTYLGLGCLAFSYCFDEVVSVEPVKAYFSEAEKKNVNRENVTLYNLQSIEYLKKINLNIFRDKKVMFYLDSHAQPSGGHTENASDPLQEEVDFLFDNLIGLDVVFIIDDYRLWNHWTNKNSMVVFLEKNSKELILEWDTVICVPNWEIKK